MNRTTVLEIQERLNILILEQLVILSSEQRHPSCDADSSDDIIRDSKENYERLSKIRTELEIIYSGAIIK